MSGRGYCVYRAELTVTTPGVSTLTTALAAARALHVATNRAVVYVHDQPIRYTLEGTAPTATLGLTLQAHESAELYGKQMDAFKAIREGGTDAEVEVAFFAD